MIPVLERAARRLVPSLSLLSYNPIFKVLVNSTDVVPRFVWNEFRKLPPNHLRIRVGVGNRLFSNQLFHLSVAESFWMVQMAQGFVNWDSTIVDIGCGCGRFAHHLRDRVYKGRKIFEGTYYGVDIDTEMLDWCSKNFDTERFHFIQSTHVSKSYNKADGTSESYYSLDIPDGSADFVFSTSLFSHLLEPELKNYLQETLRVLKPGGHMVMTFFCLDRLPHTFGGRHTFSHSIGNASVESLKVPEAAVAYKEDFIVDLCRQVGFSKAGVVGVGGEVYQCDLVATK